jgi:hypothetical protein
MAIDITKVEALLQRSKGANAYAKDFCDDIVSEAKKVFIAKNVKGNEDATSETSPPKYLERFSVRREPDRWVVSNNDPGAVFVEFGAHAGGKTPVLKYAPMRTALEIVVQRRNDG